MRRNQLRKRLYNNYSITNRRLTKVNSGESLDRPHCSRVELKVQKGKYKGEKVIHFKCNYCLNKIFQGPSTGTFLKHLRSKHADRCPELLPPSTVQPPVKKDFFAPKKRKNGFDQASFEDWLLKWIVQKDQPFSMVDDPVFLGMMASHNPDAPPIFSRRTVMRRIEEILEVKKDGLKRKLNGFKSKISITCDLWTSKNQLSFLGVTAHYIDATWTMQQEVIAFKHLEGEHDGKALAIALVEVFEELGIADRILGITSDNASDNGTMMTYIHAYYTKKYPAAGFS